ncbi:MAG: tetratricopeptide repeat protein [Deltaproteobacteria bacterium]|nr:tetratricopeptide repeat protein [Deltaproteobacteria bacterium]
MGNQNWESEQKILSDFFKSDTEKIYLVLGRETAGLYRMASESLAVAKRDKNNLVFLYEIWEGEHSKHFLYRWLRETVFGQAFQGFGSWNDVLDADPKLADRFRLLVEQDIRPLEIRFLEAVRFVSQMLKPEQRMILGVSPRTDLRDKALVDFFRELLRLIPPRVKLLIFQGEQDVLATKSDFSPSNRLTLEAPVAAEDAGIRDRIDTCSQAKDIQGTMFRTLIHLAHPAGLDLVSKITGESADRLLEAATSEGLEELLEQLPENRFRPAYPRACASVETGGPDASNVDTLAVEFFEEHWSAGAEPYPEALYHSMALFRIGDPEFIALKALESCDIKTGLGWSEISDEEMGRALRLLGEGNDALKARLCLKMGEIRESRNRFPEAMEILETAIKILADLNNPSDLQMAYELKGRAAFSIRDIDSAKSALEESVRLAREIGKESLIADVLSQLAYVHYSVRDLEEAGKYYRESRDLYEIMSKTHEREGRIGQAAQWANLGHVLYAQGDFSRAEESHRKALEIFESIGNRDAQAREWGYLGHTFFAAKDFDEAIEAYERAGKIEEEMGEPLKAAQRYASIGHTLYAQRKPKRAIRSFQKALEKYRELHDAEGEAAQLSNLGLVKGDQSESDEAVSLFEQSAGIYRELGDAVNEVNQIIRIGHVRRSQKQYQEAEKQYKEAVNRFHSLGYFMGEANTELQLGQLYTDKKEWGKAIGCFKRARTSYKKMGHLEQEALSLAMLGNAERNRGQVDEALNSLDGALKLYKKSENSLGIANVVSQTGLLYFELKKFDEAEKLYREALKDFEKKEDLEGTANLLSNLGTLYYETDQTDKAFEEYQKALTVLRNMNHPLGIAGVLQNLSYIYEKQQKFSEATASLKEAREIYEHLQMAKEMETVEQRMVTLEEQAGKALDGLRKELFPGLHGSDAGSQAGDSKVGRNDPCPCGSGKKYKKCCGAS